MSKIWLIMLIAAISALLFTNPDAAVTAMISGSHAAVDLAINLVALYGFWLGFFAILEKLNISAFISKLLRPLIRFLFKDIDAETEKYISMNMSANLLGLGNAATPMGINAINLLAKGKTYATTNMIMLIVISATSLQLLPSTVIGLRATHGSAAPASFLPASVIATVLSTVIGVLLVKLISKILPDPTEESLRLKAQKKAERSAKRGKRRTVSAAETVNALSKSGALSGGGAQTVNFQKQPAGLKENGNVINMRTGGANRAQATDKSVQKAVQQ